MSCEALTVTDDFTDKTLEVQIGQSSLKWWTLPSTDFGESCIEMEIGARTKSLRVEDTEGNLLNASDIDSLTLNEVGANIKFAVDPQLGVTE